MKEESTLQKVTQVDELLRRCQQLEDQAENNNAASTIITEMIEKGKAVMDGHGNVTVIQAGSSSAQPLSSSLVESSPQDQQNLNMSSFQTNQ